MDLKGKREKFIEYIKKQLTGGDIEDKMPPGQKPLDRIFTGFLFPVIESEVGLDSIEEEDEHDIAEIEKPEATEVKKQKRYIPPSSAGFSFFIAGENIKLRVYYNAVCYKIITSKKDDQNHLFISQQWEKQKLAADGKEIEITPKGKTQYAIFRDKAKIDALFRQYKDGYIVTITMSNI